jgi:Prokaryotic N-terminal methylation motif
MSARGNSSEQGKRGRRAPARVKRSSIGFTLIELLVVVALIAPASEVVSLSLRDPAASAWSRCSKVRAPRRVRSASPQAGSRAPPSKAPRAFASSVCRRRAICRAIGSMPASAPPCPDGAPLH